MNQTEQITFINTFLEEIRSDITTNKLSVIANMDKVELSQYIADVTANCVLMRL